MIEDEDPDAFFRVTDIFQARFQPLYDRAEGVFLDEIEQTFFGFEIVIEARQRHTTFPREVAHGSAFVSLLAEDLGSVTENLRQAAVITRCWRGDRTQPARGNSFCRRRTPHKCEPPDNSNVRSN